MPFRLAACSAAPHDRGACMLRFDLPSSYTALSSARDALLVFSGVPPALTGASRICQRLLPKTKIFVLTALTILACSASVTNSQSTAKVVGIGAVQCGQFVRDIQRTPAVQRDYLAWAQGLMSGLLLRAPPGVDEGIDLTPPTVPLLQQLAFPVNIAELTRLTTFRTRLRHCIGGSGQRVLHEQARLPSAWMDTGRLEAKLKKVVKARPYGK